MLAFASGPPARSRVRDIFVRLSEESADPIVLKLVAQDGATQLDNGIGASHCPEHAGLL
jgi:hypothetical protein